MPKLKSKRGAAKRFKVTGSGAIKHASAFRRHILTKKAQKRKRQLRGLNEVHSSDYRGVKAMLGLE